MTANKNDVVLVDEVAGRAVIPTASPLARLNYYDGKFLRAADMELEQSYLRSLVALSNQGLGAGVVHGYSTSLAGEFLEISAGLAIDPQGHPLYLPAPVKLSLQEIIDASERTRVEAAKKKKPLAGADFSDCIDVVAPPETTVNPVSSDLYVIAICRAEALCGVEDVFGARCESACATSTERPLRREGVVVRAIPLQLRTPFPTSTLVTGSAFLRSKVARSFFADEVLKHPGLLSREGLLSHAWCAGAGYDASCCEVPLAIVARGSEPFLDAWTVRRERMDAPARRYWQWRMQQRPWDVFLAQVLQFQCHLAQALAPSSGKGETHAAVDEALAIFETLRKSPDAAELHPRLMVSSTMLTALMKNLERVKGVRRFTDLGQRVLLSRGILELPPAGYLPVLPGDEVSINEQVRALLGEGVDLRFCAARHDFIGHAFDEARDLDRISLFEGLEDPTKKPKVDVLVPDGVIVGDTRAAGGLFRAELYGSTAETGGLKYRGVAREGGRPGGGSRLVVGAAGVSQLVVKKLSALVTPFVKTATKAASVPTITPTLEKNAFVRAPLDGATEARVAATVATKARLYMSKAPAPEAAASTSHDVAPLGDSRGDGFWLELSSSLPLAAMAHGDRSEVTLRATMATFSTRPVSVDVEFHGQLVATQVTPALGGTPRRLKGLVSGVVTLSLSFDTPPSELETFLTAAHRGSLAVEFTLDERSTELAVALSPRVSVLFRRDAPSTPVDVRYSVGMKVDAFQATLAELQLMADGTVTRPSHPNRVLAEHGLTIVQASRLVIDPTFLDVARPLLFPSLAPTEDGLVLQGVLDWVLFHRRREKQCTPSMERPVEVPPRKYRVLEISAREAEALQSLLRQVQLAGQGDLAALRRLVRTALAEDKAPVFAEFDGGSAHGRFTDADLDADWKVLTPGPQIAAVAWGAEGENLFVETGRLDAVEHAVAATSQPAANELRAHLTSIPVDVQQLIAADALMLFVTRTVVAPPRKYRVLELTAPTPEHEKTYLDRLANAGSGNVEALKGLVDSALNEDKDELFAEFEGGTAKPRFDPAAFATSWGYHTPLPEIAGVVWGADDESLAVETDRLDAVEKTVAATSVPATNERRYHLTTIPAALQTRLKAEGLMLFITRNKPFDATIAVVKTQNPNSNLEKRLITAITSGDTTTMNQLYGLLEAKLVGVVKFSNHVNVDGSLQTTAAQFSPHERTGEFLLCTGRSGAMTRDALTEDGEAIQSAIGANSPPTTTTKLQLIESDYPRVFQGVTYEHLLLVFRAPVLFLVAERANNTLRVLSHGTAPDELSVRRASRLTLAVPRSPSASDTQRLSEVRKLVGDVVTPNTTATAAKLPAEVSRYLKAEKLDAGDFSDVVI
ncbi:MAG: hypothetical protein ACOZQL_40470, partial [Myxococcota bacterium]